MDYRMIPATRRQLGRWAGGTTEELFIWPPWASYSQRDFALRVSTAAVELEESDFTPLPGITRWIMPLEGGLTLTHAGHGGAALAPLEPHCFEGGWATRSQGRCTDFNLMLAPGWEGRITAAPGVYPCPRGGFVGLYAFAGQVAVGGLADRPLAVAHLDVLAARGPAALVLEAGQAPAAIFVAWPTE